MARSFFIITGISLFVLITSCSRDPLDVDVSGIDPDFRLHRFDIELFSIDQDSTERAIGQFYNRYGDFFDVYNVHILNIGPASQRYYPTYLSMFINDPLNQELYRYTRSVFSDMSEIEATLKQGFRHYRYYYPDSIPPEVVTYISGFNQGLFTVGKYVGVGLDQYLGRDCKYYDMMGIADYLQYNKYPDKIPSDVAYALATKLYPYNDSLDNVLNRMIHSGMLMYFTEALLPDSEDSILIGFKPDQMKWCRNNEQQMWTHLVEKKLLFSNDDLTIRKLVEYAPYTQLYTSESPGRPADWQGWQIVRAFARRHPEMKLPEIMAIRDYQTILRESRYNP